MPPRLARMVVPAFVGWTLFVWGQRLFNIWNDDALSSSEQWGSTAYVGVFVALAVVVAVTWFGQRRGARWWLVLLAFWTVGFWAVRALQIAFGDHSAAFVIVHTVLAIVSISLGTLAAIRTTPTDLV